MLWAAPILILLIALSLWLTWVRDDSEPTSDYGLGVADWFDFF
jgi:hypothetical protein